MTLSLAGLFYEKRAIEAGDELLLRIQLHAASRQEPPKGGKLYLRLAQNSWLTPLDEGDQPTAERVFELEAEKVYGGWPVSLICQLKAAEKLPAGGFANCELQPEKLLKLSLHHEKVSSWGRA
ncbi:MAG: hypothetical protein D6730_10575 [Bacteroidetes bacterium]|nr:MAG: hypothetical protein D6730_10575 [Bacteroidota bacterium]